MPRHNIIATTDPGRRLELHWQRDGGVQLATSIWTGEGQPEPEVEQWSGSFVDLNREQINHCIQQLRTARDQAFGRDQ